MKTIRLKALDQVRARLSSTIKALSKASTQDIRAVAYWELQRAKANYSLIKQTITFQTRYGI